MFEARYDLVKVFLAARAPAELNKIKRLCGQKALQERKESLVVKTQAAVESLKVIACTEVAITPGKDLANLAASMKGEGLVECVHEVIAPFIQAFKTACGGPLLSFAAEAQILANSSLVCLGLQEARRDQPHYAEISSQQPTTILHLTHQQHGNYKRI